MKNTLKYSAKGFIPTKKTNKEPIQALENVALVNVATTLTPLNGGDSAFKCGSNAPVSLPLFRDEDLALDEFYGAIDWD